MEEQFFDYRSVERFPRQYVDTYYQGAPTADEVAIIRFLNERLRSIALPCGESGSREFFEAACGPTVHHALAISRYVDTIWMADYLSENLDEVRSWIRNEEQAHRWSKYSKMILEQQGRACPSETEIQAHEETTRLQIAKVLSCDFMQPEILQPFRQFSCVGCFYGIEVVAMSKAAFREILHRLARLVIPGGYLMLSTLSQARSYVFAQSEEAQEKLPTAYIEKSDLVSMMIEGPFSEVHVEEVPIGNDAIAGVSNILLTFAKVQ
jgi:hypothetical protein